jgi:hypothetical protein
MKLLYINNTHVFKKRRIEDLGGKSENRIPELLYQYRPVISKPFATKDPVFITFS